MADPRGGIEDHVTCSICMDLYEDPIALPCMHSFCRRCLAGIHSSSLVLKCPECRKNTQLDRGGIDSLPRNFQLGCIVNSYRREHGVAVPKLPLCSEHKSTCQLLCETCRRSICVSCLQDGHHHIDHDIKVTSSDHSADDDTELCQKHSRTFMSYCKDCRTMICLDCLVFSHRDHCLQTLEEAHLKTLQIFEGAVTDLEARRCLLKATQKSCRKMAQKLQMDSQKKLQELSLYFNRLRESLDRKETSLRRELETREKHAVEVYISKAEQAAKKETKLADMTNEIKRQLMAEKCHLFQSQPVVTERIAALLDSEENDGLPRVQGLDCVTLQTTCLDEYLGNIKWKLPCSDLKPARQAPPIAAKRKSKPSPIPQGPISTHELKQGTPVMRGPHWKEGMKDGGPGHYGIVIQTTVAPHVYMVKWPNGNTGDYKYIHNVYEEISPL